MTSVALTPAMQIVLEHFFSKSVSISFRLLKRKLCCLFNATEHFCNLWPSLRDFHACWPFSYQFSFFSQSKFAFMSKWSQVISKPPLSVEISQGHRLQVLVCSAVMMRHAVLFACLRGAIHVRKEPLSAWVPFAAWKPWALSLQGWQTGALHEETIWMPLISQSLRVI